MTFESILSILASLLAIGGAIWGVYNWLKQKPLTSLMTELADKNTTVKRQHKILSLINKRLALSGTHISSDYIRKFQSHGRSKLSIFYDICDENRIEPTPEISKLLLGYDEKKFRNEWTARYLQTSSNDNETMTTHNREISNSANNEKSQKVFLSALLAELYPDTCKRLTDILTRHQIQFDFLEGTKDIWCRDYMPVQTPSGKLVQFRYDPSYLKDPQYADSRSIVEHVDKINNINPIFSDINLDGGNVVMYGNKAIITDRVFSENPEITREKLLSDLSEILECEIIIIPAYKPDYDFTGHADGMIRFVNNNTVLVNNLEQDFKYMRDGISKALDKSGLQYINFPWFEYKIKSNSDHAIGIYLNYLEVDNLIVMPVFGVKGNKDTEALAKLKEVFPNKIIETIDYNDVALTGGILNCTTWILNR